jgi:hypothetical protein
MIFIQIFNLPEWFCGYFFYLTDNVCFSNLYLLSNISLINSGGINASNFDLIIFYVSGSLTCDFLYDIFKLVSDELISFNSDYYIKILISSLSFYSAALYVFSFSFSYLILVVTTSSYNIFLLISAIINSSYYKDNSSGD